MLKRRLIAFSGKKTCGKDYVASLFTKLMDVEHVRLSFADAVKKQVASALDIKIEDIEKEKALFRPILQWWGTEWRRGKFGQDYWVKQWAKAYEYVCAHRSSDTLVIVPDCRFPNEYAEIKQRGGIIVRVQAINRPLEVADDTHISETALDGYPFDYTVINDFKDYLVTMDQVRTIIGKRKDEE